MNQLQIEIGEVSMSSFTSNQKAKVSKETGVIENGYKRDES